MVARHLHGEDAVGRSGIPISRGEQRSWSSSHCSDAFGEERASSGWADASSAMSAVTNSIAGRSRGRLPACRPEMSMPGDHRRRASEREQRRPCLPGPQPRSTIGAAPGDRDTREQIEPGWVRSSAKRRYCLASQPCIDDPDDRPRKLLLPHPDRYQDAAAAGGRDQHVAIAVFRFDDRQGAQRRDCMPLLDQRGLQRTAGITSQEMGKFARCRPRTCRSRAVRRTGSPRRSGSPCWRS